MQLPGRFSSGSRERITLKAIFFDLGRVLVDFDLDPFFNEISAGTGRPAESIRMALKPWMDRYERGRLTTDEFFEAVTTLTGYRKKDSHHLRHLWVDIFTPINQNIAVLREIRDRHAVGLISNTCESHIHWIEGNMAVLDLLPVKILSFQTGSLKPEAEIFHAALSALGVKAEESLFIDDLVANVQGAEKIGMKGLCYQPGMDLARALRAFRIYIATR